MNGSAEYEERGNSPETPLSVSQLNWFIKNLLEQSLPSLWAEGEISDLSRPSSGHLYFTLKDEKSQIRAVVWRSAAQRLKFDLKDGLSVICRGAVEVYPPRGSYQLIINAVQPQGVGPLQLAFQQLHSRLKAEGLFEPQRKRPLPAFPRRVGFVTSPSGAAFHDFLESARALWNDFELILIPSRVQGEEAAADIVRAVDMAQRLEPSLDILVVGRGGGSLEDLWSFNEEVVVRALANCSIPTVSAVGHEVDVTLSDLAADARALTPTHAAQLLLPNGGEIVSRLAQLRRRVESLGRSRITRQRERLQALQQRSALARPHEIHQIRRQQVDDLEMAAAKAVWNLLRNKQQKLSELARTAEALSPLSVLARGYSLTEQIDATAASDPRLLKSIGGLSAGDHIRTTLGDGTIDSIVDKVHRQPANSVQPRQ